MTLNELRDERTKVMAEMARMRDLANDDKHDWSGEDEAAWVKCNGDYDKLTRQITMGERVEQAEANESNSANANEFVGRSQPGPSNPENIGDENRQADTEVTDEHRALALQAWLKRGADMAVSDLQREACRRTGLNPNTKIADMGIGDTAYVRAMAQVFRNNNPTKARWLARDTAEHRDLTTGTGSSGGFTVPTTMGSNLEINMLAFGAMLQVSDIIRTTGGENLTWPSANDTGNTGAQLNENTTIGSSVDPTFASKTYGAYKFTSELVLVPHELLQDSAFDIAATIGQMLGERLGRISNTKFTTGTGSSTPEGVVVGATLGVTAASGTAIAPDELFDLFHSVDPAYRTNARFMLHDSVLASLRKLKDTTNQYLWQSGMNTGAPDVLLGHPVTINQDMDSSLAVNNKTILFGDFSKYKIRQVSGVRFVRLDERYADTDQVGFIAFIRQDGGLLDAGTAPVKYLQQAAV